MHTVSFFIYLFQISVICFSLFSPITTIISYSNDTISTLRPFTLNNCLQRRLSSSMRSSIICQSYAYNSSCLNEDIHPWSYELKRLMNCLNCCYKYWQSVMDKQSRINYDNLSRFNPCFKILSNYGSFLALSTIRLII